MYLKIFKNRNEFETVFHQDGCGKCLITGIKWEMFLKTQKNGVYDNYV